jgi:hypothetical protein
MTLTSVSQTWIRFLFGAFTLCYAVVDENYLLSFVQKGEGRYRVPPRTTYVNSHLFIYKFVLVLGCNALYFLESPTFRRNIVLIVRIEK